MEDRPGRGMHTVPAGRAGPGLTLLLGRVALEDLVCVAARAVGVLAVGGVASPPQMLQAGRVVGELPQELGDRVVGHLARFGSWRFAGGTVSRYLTVWHLSSRLTDCHRRTRTR